MSLPDTARTVPTDLHADAPERLTGPAGFSRALLRDFSGYMISLGLLSLGNLLLLPLITACLSPAELGLYSLAETAQVQGITLSLLGMKFAYLYHYAQLTPAQRPYLLGNAISIVMLGSLAVGGVLALLFASAPAMALFDAQPLPMAWLLIPLMLGGAIQTVLLTELRASRHVRHMGIISLSQLAFWLLLSVWLVAIEGYGVAGLLSAQTLSLLPTCLAAFLLIRGRIRLAFDYDECRRLLRYGMPLMLGLTLRYGLDTICRFALAAIISIEAAGLFMVINRVSLLFESLLALPFLTAWGGLVHHALRRPEASAIISRISSIALAVASLLALLILMAQPVLFDLLAHDPMPATAGIFALLLLSRVILLVKSPLSAGILRDGRTGWSVSNNLLGLAIFLVLLWPAASMAGLTGVVMAVLAANLAPTVSLTLAAWPSCPQRILPQSLALAALPVLGAGIMVFGGPLPAWLCAMLGIAAILLTMPILRHARVTNRL